MWTSLAQTTFPSNGTVEKDVVFTAYTNATIHSNPSTTIENATLLVKGHEIIAVGNDVVIPKSTVIVDLEGKHIYPSFIDLFSNYGMPEVKRPKWEPAPQYKSDRKGAFGWNQALRADTRASELFDADSKSAEGLRKLGFGSVLSHQFDGISRGTGSVVTLGADANSAMIRPGVSSHFSFSKGSSRQSYPNSLMGAIALLRQFLYDAEWYAETDQREETNLVLESINKQWDLPWIFDAGDKWNSLRADKIGDEFGKQYIFKGSGNEYQRIEELRSSEGKFILPLDFPLAYDLSDPYLSRMVSLEEMKHWDLAPSNAVFLNEAGIEFAFTCDGLKDKKSFLPNLRKVHERGLSKEKTLAALTTIPAGMIGMENEIGSLEAGKRALFTVWDKELFEKDAMLLENHIGPESYRMENWTEMDIAGEYNLTIDQVAYQLRIAQNGKGKLSHILKEGNERDTLSTEIKVAQEDQLISFSFQLEGAPQPGVIRLAGNVHTESRIWDGKGQLEDGIWVDWVAVRQAAKKDTTTAPGDSLSLATDSLKTMDLTSINYPLGAYGWEEEPQAEVILIKNATIWTCEEEGKIESGEILISNGKILGVGQKVDMNNLFPKGMPEIKTIDAKGKHITPGIIDEHSHIAISRGVNEGSQASTAEVSIADVVDPDDIDIYRQLAGGVTCSQLLHGSANPIGGQSAIIKLRWGRSAEEMKFDEAAPFIKFALGENVKQSNWGDYATERFPQTRMGVEQVFYDHFIRAREYGEEHEAYENEVANLSRRARRKGQVPAAPRKDLEMEALLQILNKERFITCHSYVQSEINMLMHVADSMNFTLNTFTHILEGYKVADKMAEHGAGGSTFSDWWAYKFEVKDAIPYNGAILWENGVVTAFNSDDAEMARRLNQEAAKAMKYGGVPEEEALKFVTLNPAKLLHIDHRTGSLSTGKDADLVIWSDHPLSIYAKAEQTYVDGICYFDLERDRQMREQLRLEKAKLTQKMMGAAEKGEKTKKPSMKPQKHYHCDTLEEDYYGDHEH